MRQGEEEAGSCFPEAHSQVGKRDSTEAGQRSECPCWPSGGQSGSWGRDHRQFREDLKVSSGKEAKSASESREETPTGQAQEEVPARRWLSLLWSEQV